MAEPHYKVGKTLSTAEPEQLKEILRILYNEEEFDFISYENTILLGCHNVWPKFFLPFNGLMMGLHNH